MIIVTVDSKKERKNCLFSRVIYNLSLWDRVVTKVKKKTEKVVCGISVCNNLAELRNICKCLYG